MNVDHADHVIVEGTSIGHLVPIDQTSNLSLEVGEGRDAAVEVRGRLGKTWEPAAFDQCVASTLVAQDRNDLIELLIEFQDVFADSGVCLGQCTVLEYAIPTGGAAPIKQLPKRCAWRERELIKDESGYWQVPVSETDKLSSEHIPTVNGYSVAELKWTECLVYMDDVVTRKSLAVLPKG
ncbi:hypothetical protein OUZ56_018565 [Daphnia magna]|uniref:Uncharacterized protein n=1 Tax=Daphnia magna TaxID=35525 RepID=A0ABQ9Z990_9CRUS|nr:hypothetical protein OUZ56_018565 [Daphnia magna]